MASGAQPGPWGPPSGTVPHPGISNSQSPPTPNYYTALDQLQDQLLKLRPQVMAHLEDISRLVCRVRLHLQEHQEQVENFFQLVETCGQPLQTTSVEVVEVSPQEQAAQGSREPVNHETSQFPETRDPPESNFKYIEAQSPLFWELWDIFSQKCQMSINNIQNREEPMTEQVPSPESEEPGLRYSKTQPGTEDAPSNPVPTLAESSSSSPAASQEQSGLPDGAQEPMGTAHPFQKLISWDPKDWDDTWERPDTSPWQSKSLAVPHKLEKMRILHHGEPVLATAVSSFTRHAFTCSRGSVKVWSLAGRVAEDWFPTSHLHAGIKLRGAYLRTCLLTEDSRMLLMGGHNLGAVSVWELAAPTLHAKAQLPCEGLSCQALASSVAKNVALAGFTDGTVRMWDLRDQTLVRNLSGHQDGTTSIVVKDHSIWTGGLDACLRCWDLRVPQEPLEYKFKSQIMSLSHSPQEDWVLLGLANGEHWLQPTSGSQAHMAGCKDTTILGVKASPYGRWWVSVGMYDLVTIHTVPTGATVFQVPEASSIFSCDVSSNNRLIVTGSADYASVYQVTY